MSKTKKSIIANFGILSAAVDSDPQPAEPQPAAVQPPSPTLPRVGAGVIGAAQRSIGELRDERDRLKALVESGAGSSLELDASLIDPSPYPDRLADDNGQDFAAFKATFEAEGQKIPIQVRPHPERPGRYQVIYGHRRLKAAKELGLPVRALVVEMSDRDLVVSQGIENAARQDLTWIERALFAARMDDAQIKPRDIKSALAIDDAELARMRGVYRAVPLDVIELIGRAPKVGRPRWGDFAKLFSASGNGSALVEKRLRADGMSAIGSDDRFRLALTALKTREPEPDDGAAEVLSLRDADGRDIARVKVSAKELRIVHVGPKGAAFSAFLQAEMPRLVERFARKDDADT
ncbi:plasmid partitioning protein RepB [Rhizobium sp. Leaf384]|uniref:plasmid partitioning protein RepB n=1 Tax=unclassified Rhizobium TaxID=2613769 RepID=UPI0007127B95|nr:MULTISPECIES: plasmid partitioning protein RepB [unclassified Rhizobium]KQS75521.1 plasmid partitioning protein RepB [Rhizobium sp. Leaf384]KQS75770.1 plasmid partitioning protein RepB [Rhizobium sp. Leaf383]